MKTYKTVCHTECRICAPPACAVDWFEQAEMLRKNTMPCVDFPCAPEPKQTLLSHRSSVSVRREIAVPLIHMGLALPLKIERQWHGCGVATIAPAPNIIKTDHSSQSDQFEYHNDIRAAPSENEQCNSDRTVWRTIRYSNDSSSGDWPCQKPYQSSFSFRILLTKLWILT